MADGTKSLHNDTDSQDSDDVASLSDSSTSSDTDEVDDKGCNALFNVTLQSDLIRRNRKECTQRPSSICSAESEDELLRTPLRKTNSNHSNTALAVGYRHNRSFVLRGNELAVYSQDAENRMRFETTIELKNTKGTFIEPSKMMLHQQDSAMILHDPSNADSLLKLDLTRGSIVEDWVNMSMTFLY